MIDEKTIPERLAVLENEVGTIRESQPAFWSAVRDMTTVQRSLESVVSDLKQIATDERARATRCADHDTKMALLKQEQEVQGKAIETHGVEIGELKLFRAKVLVWGGIGVILGGAAASATVTLLISYASK